VFTTPSCDHQDASGALLALIRRLLGILCDSSLRFRRLNPSCFLRLPPQCLPRLLHYRLNQRVEQMEQGA
jgi:hypothetical protein